MPLTAQAKAFVAAFAAQKPRLWEEMSPAEGREVFQSFADLWGQGPEMDLVQDRVLPGEIKVRIYRDQGDAPRPAVIYFHGGGWVLGNTHTHDAVCRRIAKASGCTVISVDYSLSPEHEFPKPLEDCYTATRYVAEHPADFDIDPERIAVAGDGAGGNLAAAVTLKARDEAGPKIKMQVLIYPVIEPNFETDSYLQFAEGHGLQRSSMQWFWAQYLGDRTAGSLAAPSMAESHKGLPAAHVITAEYDILRDEGEAYARCLSEAGVATTSKRYDGNLHGFVHLAGFFDDGVHAANDVGRVLRAGLRA